MIVRYIPFIFIFLWSTGFVGAKFGLPFAEPFTLLKWRMVLVVPMFVLLVFILKRPKISLFEASIQSLVGFLIHGVYLGLVFYAIGQGVSAGLTALIVSMNPLLIAAFSGMVLDTRIQPREWLALLLGLIGVLIVLSEPTHWAGAFKLKDILWLLVALFALGAGTLLQKRYAEKNRSHHWRKLSICRRLIIFHLLSRLAGNRRSAMDAHIYVGDCVDGCAFILDLGLTIDVFNSKRRCHACGQLFLLSAAHRSLPRLVVF